MSKLKLASSDTLLRGFTFSYYTTMSIIVSYFPLFFQSKGYSTIQIGLLYSVGPMIGIVSNLFWGFMSDKYRTIKKILVIVFFGQLVMASLAFHTNIFWLLMVVMTLFSFFQQPVSSLNDSQTLLTVSGTRKSYASFRVWGSIGFAVGALVFGQFLKHYGAGYTPLISLTTITISLVLAILMKDARNSAYKKPDFAGLVPIITSKSFLAFLLIIFTAAISTRMNDGFLALFLQRLGGDQSIVGAAWMASAVSEIPVFIYLSKHGHKYKELPLLAVCCGVYALRFLLMSFVDNPLWVIAIQTMHSLSFGIFLFTAIRYIQRIVPDQFRSSGQAVFAVTWSGLAGLISGTLGGWLFNSVGPHAVYATGSALAAVAMIGFLLLHGTQKETMVSEDGGR
ncbi:MFS transporter [Paenibacillus cremeus]|uniref:MFS transporter n=1 Tax=Paenibacillus cremeus TaxID=2163881 RepID=A0A559K7Y6_9BACL|nr:MFS transporter [Paenibacillus cremeus]TVY08237.1 MFS transporter [Paenibacillus cremeus]